MYQHELKSLFIIPSNSW